MTMSCARRAEAAAVFVGLLGSSFWWWVLRCCLLVVLSIFFFRPLTDRVQSVWLFGSSLLFLFGIQAGLSGCVTTFQFWLVPIYTHTHTEADRRLAPLRRQRVAASFFFFLLSSTARSDYISPFLKFMSSLATGISPSILALVEILSNPKYLILGIWCVL